MKNLIIFFLLASIGYGQYCPCFRTRSIIYLAVLILNYINRRPLSQCGPGANPNQTTNYGVSKYTLCCLKPTHGTQVQLGDDAISQPGVFNIGFTFCFFGQYIHTVLELDPMDGFFFRWSSASNICVGC
jgi:hypothetical protein